MKQGIFHEDLWGCPVFSKIFERRIVLSYKIRGMSESDRIRFWNKQNPALSAMVEIPGAMWDGATLSFTINDTLNTMELTSAQFCILAKTLGLRILPNGIRLMHSDESLLSLQDTDGLGMRFQRPMMEDAAAPQGQGPEKCQWDESPENIIYEIAMGSMRKDQLDGPKAVQYKGTNRYSLVSINLKTFSINSVMLASMKLQDGGYKVHIIENKGSETVDLAVLWDKGGTR